MKKYLALLLALLMLLAVAGCGSGNTSGEGPSASPVEESREPAEPDAPLDDNDYRLTSYVTVLAAYHQALTEQWDMGKLMENDISELVASAYEGNPLENVGYAFLDFNNDGVDELVIGPCNADSYPENVIYDMYFLGAEREEHVFSSSERDRWYLTSYTDSGKDLGLERFGSSGAQYTEYQSVYWDGGLNVSQAVLYDGTAENPWLMGSVQDGQIVYDAVIDEELGQDILKAAQSGVITPNYTPFASRFQ